MEWIEIKVFTRQEALPAISNILQDIGAEGLITEELDDVESEDNLLIKFYLPADESIEAKLAILKSRSDYLSEYDLDIGSGRVEVETIPEEDWSKSWKKHFKPKKVTEQLVIKPTWEEYEEKSGETVVELDPGMAFGTGCHVTTTMCMAAIEEYRENQNNMLDIGTGTGILSITAALLGIKEIMAIDIDQVAIEVAKENIQLNQVKDKIIVKQGNLVNTIDKNYDLIVANLLPHIILDLIPDIRDVLHENSIFIFSGINQENKKKVKNKLKAYELNIKEMKEEEDWITIIGERDK